MPGYYDLPFAAAALPARLEALRQRLPPAASALDLGCAQGEVLAALQASGHVSHAWGFDAVAPPPRAGLMLRQADLAHLPLAGLPWPDVVLCLNVLHHLIAQAGLARAQAVLDTCLRLAPAVFVDLGSCTERGPWPWLVGLQRDYRTDEALWQALFGEAVRQPLLTYPAQGGTRTLWELRRPPPGTGLGSYRRLVAAHPTRQRLLPITDWTEAPVPFGLAPGQLYAGVLFTHWRDAAGQAWWSKRSMGRGGPHACEAAIYEALGHTSLPACRPQTYDPQLGWRFPYEPALFQRPAYHLSQVREGWRGEARAVVEQAAATVLEHPALPRRPLGELTDFQAIETRQGVRLFDFAPIF